MTAPTWTDDPAWADGEDAERELPSRLPEELEQLAPGPQLAELLASVDRSELTAGELLRVARARARLVAHQQAELTADLYRVARAVPDRGSQPGRRDAPGKYPWAEVECSFALTWTNARAGDELSLADEVIDRLPAVFEAWRAGRLDRPRVWVFANALAGVTDAVADAIVGRVIEQAPGWTTGQLAARLRRLVLAADPQAVSRRAREKVAGRRVAGFLDEDGVASLCGYELAPHRVAAAMERMSAIARAAKAAGDRRRVEQLRADVMLDLLTGDGVAAGGPITDGALCDGNGGDGQGTQEHRRTRSGGPGHSGESAVRRAPGKAPEPVAPPPPSADDVADSEQEQLQALYLAGFDRLPRQPEVKGALVQSAPSAGCTPAGSLPSGSLPAPRRGVVDLEVPLTTLIGLSQLPGQLEGWGPVIADVCRQVVAQQPEAIWRFSVYDRLGELVCHGTTSARPDPPPALPSRRRPAANDSAFVKARDRTCRAPGCRRQARYCDVDHTVDWVVSRDSRRCNLACLCRKHHLFKHSAGAELAQLAPGVLGSVTPAGMRYVTHPDWYPTELEPAELTPPDRPDPAELSPG